MEAESSTDKDKQIRLLWDQNSDLLRQLEHEEDHTTKLQQVVFELRSELDELRHKQAAELSTSNSNTDLSTKAANEGLLRAEEFWLLKADIEKLKQQHSEEKLTAQMKIEELLAAKNYQLSSKIMTQDHLNQLAEGDHVTCMDLLQVQLRELQTRMTSLNESNKELLKENDSLYRENHVLKTQKGKSERESELNIAMKLNDGGGVDTG